MTTDNNTVKMGIIAYIHVCKEGENKMAKFIIILLENFFNWTVPYLHL